MSRNLIGKWEWPGVPEERMAEERARKGCGGGFWFGGADEPHLFKARVASHRSTPVLHPPGKLTTALYRGKKGYWVSVKWTQKLIRRPNRYFDP